MPITTVAGCPSTRGHSLHSLSIALDFPHPSRPSLGPTQPPIQWVTGSFPGEKQPGRGLDRPPPSRTEVKERVEPWWPVLG